MDVATLQAHCLALPGAWPDNPWGHEHPVVKVGPGEAGKIFAFLGADGVGVKAGASREEADEWLARFPGDASVMAYIGPLRLERPRLPGRDPRRRADRGRRGVLPAGGLRAGEEAPAGGLGRALTPPRGRA